MQVSIVYPAQTGAQADYSIPFEYLSASHVKATVGGVDTPFTFNSTYVIHFATNPVGDVHIYRETPSDVPWTTFVDGSVLVSDELNGSFLQALYVSQEVQDKLPGKTTSGDWDGGNLRWKNLTDPVDDQDAATKHWVNASYNSGVDAGAAKEAAESAAATATTKAAEASTSEANAAASASTATAKAAAAATSEENSTAAAATATAKAAAASTSEANAAASASSAHTSEVNAAASAAAAALFDPSKLLPVYSTGSPLPTSDIGPIWHVDYAAIMLWDGVGYSSLGVGETRMFAFTSVPAGYLLEDGSAISRAAYAGLFRKIGTTWGAGDGSTTFNLPDSRGEFIRGFDSGRGVDAGRAFAAWQASQNLAHSHGVSDPGHAHGVYDPGHHHTYPADGSSGTGPEAQITNQGISDYKHFNTDTSTTGIGIYAAGTGISIQSSGGSEARSRNVTRLICIKF